MPWPRCLVARSIFCGLAEQEKFRASAMLAELGVVLNDVRSRIESPGAAEGGDSETERAPCAGHECRATRS